VSKKILYIGLAGYCLSLLASCSATRYVPEGNYLLTHNEILITEKKANVTQSAITPYIRQQENSRSLFGIKLHLGMYNASPRCDSCRIGLLMRKLGEPPVVFDPELKDISANNIRQYLLSQGYYHAVVTDSVRYRRRKATVTYTIHPGETFALQNIEYRLPDSLLARHILCDTSNSLLRPGAVLSAQLLEQERVRIESTLRNKGFYMFNRSLISYEADTLAGDRKANLTVFLYKNELPATADSLRLNRPYRIRNVRIYAGYDAAADYMQADYMEGYTEDAVHRANTLGTVKILYRGTRSVRPAILLDANMIDPGDYYNEADITQTYTNLSNLHLFRSISIQYDTVQSPDHGALLDCSIRLSPNAAQGFKINFETFLSSSFGLFGISPAVSYYHRNLFHGAEWLNISFSDNYQFDLLRLDNTNKRSNELAASVSISMPKFFLPYVNRYFRHYAPRTEFTASYGFQLRPEYTRNALSFLVGYNWRTTPQWTWSVNILTLNIVKLYNRSEQFYASTLRDPYLRNRYEDHFVMGANASLMYSTRQPSNRSNSVLFRWNVGFAGNVLSAFNPMLAVKNDSRLVWGTPYSQYAKTDINLSYYQVIDQRQTLAYRFFAGIGRAYGNSISLPYEEVYYAGGAYSLRGWQSRSVGPGAAALDSTFSIPNQVGDFKLEANIEYRFNLLGQLDGALFLDAGNIWSLRYRDSDELTVLDAATFLRQIALNTGFGLRLNFDFFVIRIDAGARLYEPRQYSGWVDPHNIFSISNMALHFGIGYPF
jgi:outer membrane protein assembly factor BamA